MTTDFLTERAFASISARSFEDQDGAYSIEFAYPIGLRYLEGTKKRTVFFDPQFHPRRLSWLLPEGLRSLTYKRILHIEMETPAVWDNTQELTLTPDATIQLRIERALAAWSPLIIHRIPPRNELEGHSPHSVKPTISLSLIP